MRQKTEVTTAAPIPGQRGDFLRIGKTMFRIEATHATRTVIVRARWYEPAAAILWVYMRRRPWLPVWCLSNALWLFVLCAPPSFNHHRLEWVAVAAALLSTSLWLWWALQIRRDGQR